MYQELLRKILGNAPAATKILKVHACMPTYLCPMLIHSFLFLNITVLRPIIEMWILGSSRCFVPIPNAAENVSRDEFEQDFRSFFNYSIEACTSQIELGLDSPFWCVARFPITVRTQPERCIGDTDE